MRSILERKPLRKMRRTALPELSGPMEKKIEARMPRRFSMSRSRGSPSRYPFSVSTSIFSANAQLSVILQ